MQIYFTGNTTPVKSFNIGIKGNNAADTIEFILDAQQGNVDLSACTAYVKSASPITSFADKQRVEIQSADEGKIKVSWSMLRKHTLNHSLNEQLQFEDYDRDICWNRKKILLNFSILSTSSPLSEARAFSMSILRKIAFIGGMTTT